ncbi:MAG: hypothetical protein QM775_13155 [Pirellulales bacterium]
MNAYSTTVGGTVTIASNKATAASAGITHTLGTLSIGANTLSITRGANATSGTGGVTFGATTLTGAAVFDVGANALLTLGALQTSNNFTKQGSGAMTLATAANGARTTGIVTLSAGTMNVGNASALGAVGVSLQLNGGLLDLATDSTVNAHNTTVGGTVTIASDKATAASAGITHTLGTLSIGANTLTITRGANATTGTGGVTFGNTSLTGAAVFDVGSSALLTLGALQTTGNFTKQGSGAITLATAANAARTSGVVTLSAGTMNVGNARRVGHDGRYAATQRRLVGPGDGRDGECVQHDGRRCRDDRVGQGDGGVGRHHAYFGHVEHRGQYAEHHPRCERDFRYRRRDVWCNDVDGGSRARMRRPIRC